MTFTELRTEIMDRLNLSSSTAQTRIGRAINRKYRVITSSVGLQLSRRNTISQAVTAGVSTVVFTNTEKVINVVNRAVSPYRFLDEITIDELQKERPFAATDFPTKYAVYAHTSDTVTVLLNCVPQTGFTLYADVHQGVADLSGANEPAFPESFHDIIIEGVLSDELRKMEKPQLASIAQAEYERLLSDLRYWIAKNNFVDLYQGKTETKSTPSTFGGSGSGTVPDGTASYTQTGLITFDRDPSAPFAVTASSAVVPNLDADLLDGQHGSYYRDASNLNAGTVPIARLSAGTTTYVSNSTTGAINNWSPGLAGNTVIDWSGASDATITGLSNSGITAGTLVVIKNNGTGNIYFAHQSGSSSVGNRFANLVTSNSTPIAAAGGYAIYQYVNSEWALIGHEQGAWITPTFSAGDYRGSGGQTWTLAAGDVFALKYRLSGNTIQVLIDLRTTSVGGVANPALNRIIPGGYTSAAIAFESIVVSDNGAAAVTGRIIVNSGGITIDFYRDLTTTTNWTASANLTLVQGMITIEVT